MTKQEGRESEEEERKLLESLGLLLQEPSEQHDEEVVSSVDTRCDDGIDNSTTSIWTKLQNAFYIPSSAAPATKSNQTKSNSNGYDTTPTHYNPILLGVGGTLFLLPHLAIILSLPPVLQRRGAPYLPTFGNKLNIMFDLIRKHVSSSTSSSSSASLKFVDLGSGDGRVVFRAAREGLFHKSVGYEINPALHMWVKFRQLVTPKYWSSTEFYLRDLWKIKLHNYNVVAVYGLYPIMDRLGKKLQDELRPGSIVVSNVFEIPNWKAAVSSSGGGGNNSVGREGVYLYKVPECYRSVLNKTQDVS